MQDENHVYRWVSVLDLEIFCTLGLHGNLYCQTGQMPQLVKLDLFKEGKVTGYGNHSGENVKIFCYF